MVSSALKPEGLSTYNLNDDARGRNAVYPHQIPRRGWRDIAWRTWTEFSEDNLSLVAAGAAFYVLLSLVPMLATVAALYGLLADADTARTNLATIAQWVPAEGRAVVDEQLIRLAQAPPAQLGGAFIATFVLSLWSASAATKALMTSLNIVYDENERRGFLTYNVVAIGLTLAGIVGAVWLIASSVIVPVALSRLGMTGDITLQLIVGFSSALIGGAVLTALYRWGPSRVKPKFRWLISGVVLSVILLALLASLFSWYARNFATYSTLGTIGGALAFMTWSWLSLIVLLLGAEFNAEIEHQTARDSTVGQEKPLGARGAVMADTIGAAADGYSHLDPHAVDASTTSRSVAYRTDTKLVVLSLLAGVALGFLSRRHL